MTLAKNKDVQVIDNEEYLRSALRTIDEANEKVRVIHAMRANWAHRNMQLLEMRLYVTMLDDKEEQVLDLTNTVKVEKAQVDLFMEFLKTTEDGLKKTVADLKASLDKTLRLGKR